MRNKLRFRSIFIVLCAENWHVVSYCCHESKRVLFKLLCDFNENDRYQNHDLSVSVFVALSTVFHSINSPDNSPLSHSVLPVLSLP